MSLETKWRWIAGTPKPIQIVCGHCGSANVMRDATARWDTDEQAWLLSDVQDQGTCDVCGVERNLDEVDLDTWIEQRDADEPAPGGEDAYVVGAMFDDLSKWFAVVKRDDNAIWTGEMFSCPREAKDAARSHFMRKDR